VDVRSEVNQFFMEGRRRASFNPQQLYPPTLVPTIWAYVDAQDGDEVLYGCNALSMLERW
jgi:hypothetical protein